MENHIIDPNIVVIGGGTGSFTLLKELKNFTPNISAVVNMSDDGGSSGRLRDELGVLPPGDVRQCLVALSGSEDLRDLFSYRFGEGSLAGQSLGNVILSGLELQQGSFDKAIKVASSILAITGKVIPVTLENHTLLMRDNGEVVRGEFTIGHRLINDSDPDVYIEPEAKINDDARQAILDTDLTVIAPGNLYGSLLPALAVNGMRETIQESKSKKVVISNLVTKPGQTDNWHVVDYVKSFEKYVGKNQIDYVIYNDLQPSDELLEKYAADGEYPVATDPERFDEISAQAIGAPLLASDIQAKNAHDHAVPRTLIRHDAIRTSQLLIDVAGM